MLRGSSTDITKSNFTEEVEVQEDVIEQSCKIENFLTPNDQVQEASQSKMDCEIIDDTDSVFNEVFLQENLGNGQPGITQNPMDFEPIFKVEKVNPLHFSDLYSFTGLDSNSEKLSACVSEDEDFTESMDVEMEEVSRSLGMKENANSQLQYLAEKEGQSPTFSCTQTFIG